MAQGRLDDAAFPDGAPRRHVWTKPPVPDVAQKRCARCRPGRILAARPVLTQGARMPRPTTSAEPGTSGVLAPGRGRGPACWSLVVAFTTYLVLGWVTTRLPHQANALSWYASVMWTAPVLTAGLGVTGAVLAGRRASRTAAPRGTPRAVDDRLVVVVPTIGRDDTCTALARVLESFVRHLPSRFSAVRVDVVIEEGCEAEAVIQRMAETDPAIRVLVVPCTYRTTRGSRFKARANHYAHELRLAEGEATDDTWVLHMDDDTAVGPDTA